MRISKLIIFIIVLLLTKSIFAEELEPRWDNNVLRGHICTIDSIETEKDGQIIFEKHIKPLESAAVMLFKTKNQAEKVRNKFEGMSTIYDSLEIYCDSSSMLLNNYAKFHDLAPKIINFAEQSQDPSISEDIKQELKTSGNKILNNDSTFVVNWANIFKNINLIYKQDNREISTVTRFGTETESSGRFDIISTEKDKYELKYLLAGLMGYDFTLKEINTSLPDTIYLKEKVFTFNKINKDEEAVDPYKPVYNPKLYNFISKKPEHYDFDANKYCNQKIIPADLSIGFFDYCWYYTYNTGAYIGGLFSSAGNKEKYDNSPNESNK